MHLRPVQRGDLPYLATLLVRSAWEDELHRWLNPLGSMYPEDLRRYHVYRMKLAFETPGQHGFVCVADESDHNLPHMPDTTLPSGEVILGLSFWQCGGAENAPLVQQWRQNNTSLLCKLNMKLLKLEERYTTTGRFNPALHWPRTKHFREFVRGEDPSLAPISKVPGNRAYWELGGLATASGAKRRGVGSFMVKWGMERAALDDVPLTVHASIDGVHLYSRLGFKTLDWEKYELEPGIALARTMVWDHHWANGSYPADCRWWRSAEHGPEEWVERPGTLGPGQREVVWNESYLAKIPPDGDSPPTIETVTEVVI